MSSHRSHVARRAALGSTVDPLHGLISLGLINWDGRNQLADSAVNGMHLATVLAKWLLTLHEEVVLEVSTLARQMGEMRVWMMELELAWERMEFQTLSLGYISAGGEEVGLVEEGIEEEVVEEEVGLDEGVEEGLEEGEEEVEMGEEGLWSPNSSDRAILALVPDSSVFPTQ
ncbi:hypothetical protein BDM02DRAFT_3129084 [Thelephora ganbajun]|uniref:Uncharacterized protein n=1 Tax=Thelephora ganbajun TaxID=370292 RepID=A0ACB6ZFN3_THEGA|nr:hypothetical protein BDM02DRAFT_3129084 [Thelephora ganbajun]